MRAMPMEDPRDNLEKATRDELWAYAKAMGVQEVREPMPADLCRHILRARGLTNIRIPERVLGTPPILGKDLQPADNTLDAIASLQQQYEQQQKNPDIPLDVENMPGHLIRKELKRRGVKMSRTDTLEILKAKLNGQNAA